MEITRRNLLGAGAAVGAGLLLPLNLRTVANAAKPTPNVLTPFTELLPTLTELGVIDATTPGTTATIEMVTATHRFHTALGNTPTFAYRHVVAGVPTTTQDYLGPVIVARQNVPFKLTMVNNLGKHPLVDAIDYDIMGTVPADATAPRAAVHLHGGNTDPTNDGDPLDTFDSGVTRDYHYENTQEAAGLWYHDHALGMTRLNVFAGLAGGYLVRDANDPGDGSTGLPPAVTAGLGNYEVPLVIQDRMFNANGTFNYPLNPTFAPTDPPTGRKWAPEFFGDVATVNGKIQPRLDVKQGKYRFRMVNGSNARFYNFKLKSSLGTTLTFFQIGTDGGLLNAPVPLTKLLLAPGERADVVVDFAGLPLNTTIVLANDAVTPFPNGPRKLKKGGMPLPQIMQFKVVAPATGDAAPFTAALPTQLRATPVTPLAGLVPTLVRDMTLVEILDPLLGPMMALMNNRSFHHTEKYPMTPSTNTLEQWNLINLTGDAHPMHLHFTQFQILNRQKFDAAAYTTATYGPAPLVENTGPMMPPPVPPAMLRGGAIAPAANEAGWKDTVIAMPGEVTRILVPFGAEVVPDLTTPGSFLPMAIGKSHLGKYVSHCHILEHEENDMMMRFEIIDPPPPAP